MHRGFGLEDDWDDSWTQLLDFINHVDVSRQ